MSRLKVRISLTAVAIAIPLLLWAEERVDLSIVNRIRTEAFQNSKVMDHLFFLTDVHGPRIAGSPAYRKSADWVLKRMGEYGIPGKLETFQFGRSWEFNHFEGHMIEPQYAPLIGFPMAWTPGTDGDVTGEAMIAIMRTEADLDAFKGKLKGKIVLVDSARTLGLVTQAPSRRYTEQELADLSVAPEPGASPFGMMMPPRNAQPRSAFSQQPQMNFQQMRQFRTKLSQFLRDEAPLLVLRTGSIGDGGTVFGSSAGSQDPKDPIPPPTVVITPEHYNRIARLIEHEVPVKLSFNIKARMVDSPGDGVNVIAEIEGGRKKDEIVLLGGHLDSWHGGTGATDNAAGCAVMMEAMRILKGMNIKFDRTIRMGLWDAEEEGLLGSRAYVKQHFADPEVMKPTAEHAKFSAYFNVDNGGGKLRGIYLQGNDMLRPVFQSWLEPFRDLGATTVTIRNTGGTDHQSFDAVGLPGFQFIQDTLEYNSRTHHSNMDVYDRIQAGDLMQASAIVASFAYNAAMRDEMLARKPLPKPQPRRGGPGGPPARPTE